MKRKIDHQITELQKKSSHYGEQLNSSNAAIAKFEAIIREKDSALAKAQADVAVAQEAEIKAREERAQALAEAEKEREARQKTEQTAA